MRALDLAEGSLLTPGDLGNLWIWGFALIAVAAIAARPGSAAATALTGERVDAGEAG